jgi:hypothetical protein
MRQVARSNAASGAAQAPRPALPGARGPPAGRAPASEPLLDRRQLLAGAAGLALAAGAAAPGGARAAPAAARAPGDWTTPGLAVGGRGRVPRAGGRVAATAALRRGPRPLHGCSGLPGAPRRALPRMAVAAAGPRPCRAARRPFLPTQGPPPAPCPPPPPQQVPEDPDAPKFFKTPGGVKVQELARGAGAPAGPGDTVLFDYTLRRADGYFVYVSHPEAVVHGAAFDRRLTDILGRCLLTRTLAQPPRPFPRCPGAPAPSSPSMPRTPPPPAAPGHHRGRVLPAARRARRPRRLPPRGRRAHPGPGGGPGRHGARRAAARAGAARARLHKQRAVSFGLGGRGAGGQGASRRQGLRRGGS